MLKRDAISKFTIKKKSCWGTRSTLCRVQISTQILFEKKGEANLVTRSYWLDGCDLSMSYPPKHAYNRRPQSNANYPPRFRRTFEQNLRRESHDSSGQNEEHQNNNTIASNNNIPCSNTERNDHSRSSGSHLHRGPHMYRSNKHYRNPHRSRDLQEHEKCPKSSGSRSFAVDEPGAPSGTNPSTSSVEHLTSGAVINGRYVRKSVLQSSQLNADAPPFIPKKVAESVDKDRNGHSLSGQRFDRKQRREVDHNYENLTKNSHHSRNRSSNSGSYGSSKPKSHKNLARKNSAIGNEIASGSELCADDLESEEWEIDSEVAGTTRNINQKSVEKDPTIYVSKTKESTTQRERLISQLEKGECECLVCCEPIRSRNYVWSCSNCFHVFHLQCIKKWARSPAAVIKDNCWRCPACQNSNDHVPLNYYCFCGKSKDPQVNFHYTPHTCGEICGKRRPDEQCIHTCNILCHPGPCPPCTATVNRTCACGKIQNMVPCARNEPLTCSSVCGKVLNCGLHTCADLCHVGDCKPCSKIIIQECYCSREVKNVLCTASVANSPGYSCGMVCGKKLSCGNHVCTAVCHDGPCAACSLMPSVVTTCPCGKTPLKEMMSGEKPVVRHSCTDPVPVCGNKCEKLLPCGPKGNPHKCNSECHLGDCPPCNLTTTVKCRCGSTHKEFSCVEMLQLSGPFMCEKRCNRRKDCGRHKCLNNCCVNTFHKCELVCNKKLSCGLHHCEETCHAGNCHTCWNVSFDELRCHCGYTVRYPPIPCGTKPPECDQPCARSHPCDHKVQHTCHSEETCPPCTLLTVKWCFGHHERRPNVHCFLDGMSCGKLCNKPLPCGRHKCLEVCHSGCCLKPNISCSQPCDNPRTCGHPCGAPCHDGPCPETMCKAKVEVSCPCGLRTETMTCSEDSNAYRLMSVSILASKIQDIKAGESVNISDIFSKKGKTSRLQCNEACAVHERNKRLAVALQIQNPDLSCKPGAPAYSEFLKEEARKNLKFVSSVYDKISDLVLLAKESKQKCRSFAFPSMKRDQRRVIHELAEFFGCETQSYDEEPVKNVVVTAFRDKSWLPFVNISSVVEREMGLRRGPNPIVSVSTSKASTTTEKREKLIDYFDYTEEH